MGYITASVNGSVKYYMNGGSVKSIHNNNIANTYGWTKYYCTFTITDDLINDVKSNDRCELRIECSTSCTSGKYIYWAAPKLEKGNKPTDWSPAPEDTLSQTSEVIVGTQTGTTASWTGVASFSSLENNQQITYWLPQTSANNATLNLTLAGGGTTGAKPLYYGGTSRLGTHYPAGSVIHLTYRKNVTIGSTTIAEGWWADANYDSNNYDRIRLNNNIKAKSAITNSRLIVGDSGGYFHLAAGSSFDIDKPILWAASDIAANGTGSNNYLSMPSCTIRNNTNSSWTATQNLTLYLVGVLSGNKFIVDSTTPFTTNLPTAENSQYYISLGYMISTYQIYLYPEHPIFKYSNGEFRNISQIAYEAFTSEIGGVNKLVGSSAFREGKAVNYTNTKTNDSWKKISDMMVNHIEPNTEYVYQVKCDKQLAASHGYSTNNIGKFTLWLVFSNTNGDTVSVNFNSSQTAATANPRYLGYKDGAHYWKWKSPTYQISDNSANPRVNTYADNDHPITINWWDFKFEKGNKPTDWSPPPEDVDKSIGTVASTASAAKTDAGTAIQRINTVERNIRNFVKDDTGMVSVTEDGSRNKN